MWNSLCRSIFSPLSPCLSFRDDIHVSVDTQETDRLVFSICCCCSVAKSCLTLWDPMDCSMSGLPVLYCLLEFAQVNAFSKHSWKHNSTDQNLEEVIVWSQTLHIHYPAADLVWDSNGMTDSEEDSGKGVKDRDGASWEAARVCPEVLKRYLEGIESHFTG